MKNFRYIKYVALRIYKICKIYMQMKKNFIRIIFCYVR